jgi:tetratricopeptide (TPR) repeat protein
MRVQKVHFTAPKFRVKRASMIQHQVYFDTLGSMREGTPSWRSVFAGLSVLRFVDAYAAAASPLACPGWTQLHSVRVAIEEMSEGDVIRGVLTGVIDDLTTRGCVDDAVCGSLLAYGRALDYDASWGLATDVFATVAKMVKPESNARLSVEAYVAAGGAARRNGEWEISARAYSQAAYIADTLGDRPGVLTVQVGIANTYLAKGNLPQAQSILDDVIVQAADQDLPEIQGMALHSRGAIATRKGNHAEGLKLAYDALSLTRKPSEKDLVLGDIAAMFTQLGMHESARDAHLILASTSQTKFVRWSATLNLMELASLEGVEEAFDRYARELAQAPLGAWVRSHYLLFLGEGFQRFGRIEAATEALEEAVHFAESNQIHQVAFKAQAALAAVRSTQGANVASFTPPPSTWVPNDIETVVRGISDLRKAALSSF